MNDKILSKLEERDLHCVLNKFCSENLDIKTKTIYHERSTRSKGKSEWLHPDMVGFQLTTSSWDNNIIEVCKNFYISKAILYSFELKKSITIDTLREYYFQAVSNSSWANEGYLVTASLDEDNFELISEIKRLVGAFGIGIIKLDIINPKNSTILFPAKRKDTVDGETMNKLYTINPDYQSYIQDIVKSLQISQFVGMQWDDIKDYNKLYDRIKSYYDQPTKKENIEDSKLIPSNISNNIIKEKSIFKSVADFKTEASIDKSVDNAINKIVLTSRNVQLSYTKPVKCVIGDKVYEPNDWADLLFKISIDLKENNSYYFEKYKEISRLFSEVKKKDYPYYHEGLNLYVASLSINSKYRELQKLLNIYNIDLNKCIIYYESRELIENMITIDNNNVNLDFSKPIKCVINNKVYTDNQWKSLMFSIASDLNKIDSFLFKKYVKASNWCTEVKRWKDAKYSEELGVYVGGLSAFEMYKEIQKLLNVYDIDLSKCTLYYKGAKK